MIKKSCYRCVGFCSELWVLHAEGQVYLHMYLCLCWWTESRSPGLMALEEEAAAADWEPTSAPEGRPLSRRCPCWDSTRCAQVNDLHRQTAGGQHHGQVTKGGTTIWQQLSKALTIHWPTTRKYWSNSPTLTDSSSDSLMERQQHRQTSGSPESIMSNTDMRWREFHKTRKYSLGLQRSLHTRRQTVGCTSLKNIQYFI